MNATPAVSVVLPTWNRPDFLRRALESVRAQEFSDWEVIVVSDGPSEVNRSVVEAFADSRARYLENDSNLGVSATRNRAIQAARGQWVALLDDDDEWLPTKLRLQIELAKDSPPHTLVSGRVEVIPMKGRRFLLPPRMPKPSERVGDYLFALDWRMRTGVVHASTLLAPRKLFTEVPYDTALERHEDWKWLIEVGHSYQANIRFVPDVIVREIRHQSGGLRRRGGYQYSKNWYLSLQHLMSPAARAGCVSALLARKAAFDREFREIPWLFRELLHLRKLCPLHFLCVARRWLDFR